jgi:hypothetical protein
MGAAGVRAIQAGKCSCGNSGYAVPDPPASLEAVWSEQQESLPVPGIDAGHSGVDVCSSSILADYPDRFQMSSRLRQPRTWQKRAVLAGGGAGLLALLVLNQPGNEALHAHGPMNSGHEEIACAECHEPAPGTARQQIQANLRHVLGQRSTAADFGRQPAGSDACLACHDRPNERHPIYRFIEPRFAEARAALHPETCISCHVEHSGRRVTLEDNGFCRACHEDTRLRKDPVDVPHERLISEERWETCLGCHDFHGNHVMRTRKLLGEAIAPAAIRSYFEGGPSPFGDDRHHKALRERPR